MSSIRYILNEQSPANHLAVLERSLRESHSCFLALAYLKNEGLDLVRDAMQATVMTKPVEIIIGLPYYNTHPKAIEEVYQIVSSSGASILRFVDYEPWIFHCKLLWFNYGTYAEAIVGSMNITLGGLVHNFEISSLARHERGSPGYKEVEAIKAKIREISRPASARALAEYRQRFQERQVNA
jgi:HKD family nuclease